MGCGRLRPLGAGADRPVGGIINFRAGMSRSLCQSVKRQSKSCHIECCFNWLGESAYVIWTKRAKDFTVAATVPRDGSYRCREVNQVDQINFQEARQSRLLCCLLSRLNVLALALYLSWVAPLFACRRCERDRSLLSGPLGYTDVRCSQRSMRHVLAVSAQFWIETPNSSSFPFGRKVGHFHMRP